MAELTTNVSSLDFQPFRNAVTLLYGCTISKGGKMVVQPSAGPNEINIPCRLSLGHDSEIFFFHYMFKKKCAKYLLNMLDIAH